MLYRIPYYTEEHGQTSSHRKTPSFIIDEIRALEEDVSPWSQCTRPTAARLKVHSASHGHVGSWRVFKHNRHAKVTWYSIDPCYLLFYVV